MGETLLFVLITGREDSITQPHAGIAGGAEGERDSGILAPVE